MASGFSYPTGTAAITWFDSAGEIHIRVYTTDGNNVTERCIDQNGSWYTGTFTAPGRQVSAVCWLTGGDINIRVYCTEQDKTTEWCSGPKSAWKQGSYTTS